MTAKDMMADILESEKNLVVNMAISLNEASCDTLYKKYKSVLCRERWKICEFPSHTPNPVFFFRDYRGRIL